MSHRTFGILAITVMTLVGRLEAESGHRCQSGACNVETATDPATASVAGTLYLPSAKRQPASVREPAARGANDRKPFILASAYANPSGIKLAGQANVSAGLSYLGAKTDGTGIGLPKPTTGSLLGNAFTGGLLLALGAAQQTMGAAAAKDLEDRAKASLKADGGLGGGALAAPQNQPIADTVTKSLLENKKAALQAYLGDEKLKPSGLDNVRNLGTVDLGSGAKAPVHSLPRGQTLELGGTKFTGGPPPKGSTPVGYFMPMELKPGTHVHTGDERNVQTTLKVGDKTYAMFFPPGTKPEQMAEGIRTAKAAIEAGLDPSKVSATARDRNSVADPAAGLKGLQDFAKRDAALREVEKLEADAKAWEDRIEKDGLDANPDEAAEKTKKLGDLSKQLRDESLDPGKVDGIVKEAKLL